MKIEENDALEAEEPAGCETEDSLDGETAENGLQTPEENHNREIGRRGEEAAVCFLKRRGYEILDRNWVCKEGEADIVARDDDALVFIEVKTRTNIEMGLPSEAVDEAKRSRYEKIAARYLQNYEEVDIPVRFDVIAILVVAKDRALIRHHVNAFGAY